MTTALTADTVRAQLRVLGSPAKAEASSWFFKTGAGQYGEGDVFLGVTVPELRRVAKAAMGMDHREVLGLLHSPEHECRLAALLVWTYQFTKGSEPVQQRIFEDYLANTGWINNWDLVDASCREIVGGWLFDRDRSTLDRLAVSDSVWERRIAIVSTFHFIRLGQPQDTLRIADLLIDDRHDLIHKAVGWMLREVGKRCDQAIEEEWLQTATGRCRGPCCATRSSGSRQNAGRPTCRDGPGQTDRFGVMFSVETRTVAGSVTSVGSAGPYTVVIDRPVEAGGGGLGFNGGQLLYLAIAGCVSNDLYREAAAIGLQLDSVRVSVSGNFEGSPAVSTPVTYTVEISGQTTAEQLTDLVRHVDRIAEIPNSLRQGTTVELAGVTVSG